MTMASTRPLDVLDASKIRMNLPTAVLVEQALRVARGVWLRTRWFAGRRPHGPESEGQVPRRTRPTSTTRCGGEGEHACERRELRGVAGDALRHLGQQPELFGFEGFVVLILSTVLVQVICEQAWHTPSRTLFILAVRVRPAAVMIGRTIGL